MVKEYVGARYVPKFYTNPVTGDNTWRENTPYENLMIVTFNGDSYTSKKIVPYTIGNPAENPEYWVKTGNYNSQIASLERDYDELLLGIKRLEHYNTYYIEDFGGKANDNTVDNTQPLVDALREATANGGKVQLMAGTYYFQTPINVPFSLEAVEISGALNSTTDRVSEGTVLRYDGYGTFITFNKRFWRCYIHDFDILTPNANIGIYCAETVHLTRWENFTIRECVECFRIGKFAYAYFNYCLFRPRENTTDACCFRIGDGDTTKTAEYIYFNECIFDSRSLSQSQENMLNSYGIYCTGGIHIYLYGCDFVKCDIGIYIRSDRSTRFINLYSVDLAACHKGVAFDINGNSIRNFAMYSPVYSYANLTNYGPTFNTDAFMVMHKLSGGSTINASVKCYDASVIKSGISNIDVVLDTDTLDYERSAFTYAMPSTTYDYGTRFMPFDFSAPSATSNTDLDTITESGFSHYQFTNAAPNNPGFSCFLFVVNTNNAIIQYALPIASGTLKYRRYSLSTSTWSSWADM